MEKIESILADAVDRLVGDATCVLVRPGMDAQVSREKGIRPLLLWLSEDNGALRGAVIADRIIGRAAALLAVYGGAVAVYGEVMGKGAVPILEGAGIVYSYKTLTEQIINRKGDGPCPMEQAVAGVTDPARAAAILQAKVMD